MRMWYMSRTIKDNTVKNKVTPVDILHWNEQTAIVSCDTGRTIIVDCYDLWKANSNKEIISEYYKSDVIDWSDIDKGSEFTVTEYIRQSKPWGL